MYEELLRDKSRHTQKAEPAHSHSLFALREGGKVCVNHTGLNPNLTSLKERTNKRQSKERKDAGVCGECWLGVH